MAGYSGGGGGGHGDAGYGEPRVPDQKQYFHYFYC